ncbi:uncharacterized protein LOC116618187 [Nematostella vectensis]|uniref:uncharacterized protein LOC116618187 n=1 Tax=Nematostella vectensis TaxID=45351 RepID=UPI0020775FA6|nr:uncharacterized protein LOC116618187 [Nematostella vectensis]
MWPTTSAKWQSLFLVCWWPCFIIIWPCFSQDHGFPNPSAHVRHLGNPIRSLSSRRVYDSATLKSIRKTQPKQRIDKELWLRLKDLGIRKPFRSSRKSRVNRSDGLPVPETTGTPSVDDVAAGTLKASIPSLVYSNIRSIQHKIDELQTVVNLNRPQIVCITESWLHPDIPDAAVNLPGFSCFRRDRTHTSGGGVCVYVDSNISCTRLSDYESQDIESIWIDARPRRLPRKISRILLGSVYHSTSCDEVENCRLLEHLQSNTESFLRNHPEGLVLICGDFNPTSTRFSVVATKRATGLSQIVKVLTRDTGILDWCLTNMPNSFAPVCQLPKIGRSDHYTLLIAPILRSLKPRAKTTIWKRDLRPSKIRDFGCWITQQRWTEVFDKQLVSEKFQAFSDVLYMAVDKYLPLRKISICSSDKPWVSNKLKYLVSKRQKALHQFGNDSPQFKMYRNSVQEECKKSKASYYKTKVAKLKNTNVKRWWKEVKGLSGDSGSSRDWSQQMLCDDIPTTSDLATRFNNFLGSLTAHFEPLPPQAPGSFYQVPDDLLIDNRHAYQALRQVKTNKSSGPDPIPARIWNTFAIELAPVVCDLYNASLIQGYVPAPLKQSEISPIPKCPRPKVVEDDLRPIALTSQLAKVLEGFTLQPLFHQVLHQLDWLQFAVAGKSTTEALVYVMHIIFEALDKGDCWVRLFFSDFSKGFDLVDHNVLIAEMSHLGVHECIIRWVSSFVSNRSQYVKIRDSRSHVISPKGGIPQGTRLAPLLFAILVNRLARDWQYRIKYVDDATVFEIVPRNSPSYLPFVANDINSYALARNMRLNAKKCKEMAMCFLTYNSTELAPMLINGCVIERVDCYKLLGVHITSDFSWNTHCDAIVKKATKRLYAIRALKKSGLSSNDLIQVYCSTMRPVLEYASPVWSALPEYLVELVESVQKKVLRIVFPNLSYHEALSHAKLETLCQRRETACIALVAKAKRGGPLKRLIPIPVATHHGYGLRSGTASVVPICGRTNRLNNFCTYRYQQVM